MRLDLFLKKTCILRQRSTAKEVCDAGAVRINGHVARASHLLHPGDLVHVQLPNRDLEFRVVDLPHGNIAKRDAARYVDIVRDERSSRFEGLFEGE